MGQAMYQSIALLYILATLVVGDASPDPAYRDTPIGYSYGINRGDTVGLVDPNGCGVWFTEKITTIYGRMVTPGVPAPFLVRHISFERSEAVDYQVFDAYSRPIPFSVEAEGNGATLRWKLPEQTQPDQMNVFTLKYTMPIAIEGGQKPSLYLMSFGGAEYPNAAFVTSGTVQFTNGTTFYSGLVTGISKAGYWTRVPVKTDAAHNCPTMEERAKDGENWGQALKPGKSLLLRLGIAAASVVALIGIFCMARAALNVYHGSREYRAAEYRPMSTLASPSAVEQECPPEASTSGSHPTTSMSPSLSPAQLESGATVVPPTPLLEEEEPTVRLI